MDLAFFLEQLSPENRRWMESQPQEVQQGVANRWGQSLGGSLETAVGIHAPDAGESASSADDLVASERTADG
jgi:hypothetical protein